MARLVAMPRRAGPDCAASRTGSAGSSGSPVGNGGGTGIAIGRSARGIVDGAGISWIDGTGKGGGWLTGGELGNQSGRFGCGAAGKTGARTVGAAIPS